MKTLVCANQKGGVGKTTLLVHLAFYFSEQGKNVAVIDVDHQANASFTLSKFSCETSTSQAFIDPETNGAKMALYVKQRAEQKIFLVQADPNLLGLDSQSDADLAESMECLLRHLSDSGIDIVLIDTPPALVPRFAASLRVADCVVSPIELEAYSIQGISLMLITIKNVRDKYNKKLNFLEMVPNRVINTNPRHRVHLAQLQKAYPDMMIPFPISQRGSIAEAVLEGTPVWRIKRSAARKAAKEVRAVAGYILAKLEGE